MPDEELRELMLSAAFKAPGCCLCVCVCVLQRNAVWGFVQVEEDSKTSAKQECIYHGHGGEVHGLVTVQNPGEWPHDAQPRDVCMTEDMVHGVPPAKTLMAGGSSEALLNTLVSKLQKSLSDLDPSQPIEAEDEFFAMTGDQAQKMCQDFLDVQDAQTLALADTLVEEMRKETGQEVEADDAISTAATQVYSPGQLPQAVESGCPSPSSIGAAVEALYLVPQEASQELPSATTETLGPSPVNVVPHQTEPAPASTNSPLPAPPQNGDGSALPAQAMHVPLKQIQHFTVPASHLMSDFLDRAYGDSHRSPLKVFLGVPESPLRPQPSAPDAKQALPPANLPPGLPDSQNGEISVARPNTSFPAPATQNGDVPAPTTPASTGPQALSSPRMANPPKIIGSPLPALKSGDASMSPAPTAPASTGPQASSPATPLRMAAEVQGASSPIPAQAPSSVASPQHVTLKGAPLQVSAPTTAEVQGGSLSAPTTPASTGPPKTSPLPGPAPTTAVPASTGPPVQAPQTSAIPAPEVHLPATPTGSVMTQSESMQTPRRSSTDTDTSSASKPGAPAGLDGLLVVDVWPELMSVPPPALSDAAIKQRLRRVFKPRANGDYLIGEEWRKMWEDLSEGRDKVIAVFEKAAYSVDSIVCATRIPCT